MADLEAQVKVLLNRMAAVEKEVDTLKAAVRKIGDAAGSALDARLKALETGKKDKVAADQELKKFSDKVTEQAKAIAEQIRIEQRIMLLEATTKPLVINMGRILASCK